MYTKSDKIELSTNLKSEKSYSESEESLSREKDFTAGASVQELLSLVAALERANAQLIGEQRIDPTTGLLNRRALLAELEMEWGIWRRSGRFASLILVDIKNFKSYIDSYDCNAESRALICAARHLSQQFRTSDSLAHLNHNEFAIILRDTDDSRAQQVVDKLRTNELTAPLDKPARDNQQLIMRYCVGGATLSSHINSVQQWINAAEKNRDRNKFQKCTSYSTRNHTTEISIYI